MLMPAFLYIDPGTGGMLFTIIFAALGTVYYLVQALSVKLKFMISGGKAESISEEKIPIAIFSDHKRYFNIFEPICDELERRGQKASFLTASEDDPIFEKNYKNIDCVYLGEGNKAFSKLNLLNATMVLSTTPSLDVFQWKRSKDVNYYVHIPHAPDDITKYRMFGIDSYDALLLSGAYQIDQVRELEHLRGIPEKETALVGIPYMDEMKKRLEKEGAAAEHDRTVLLAPSWGESGILSKYGEKFIDALIATGYHVIVRPHPQSFASEKEL
ncbi:MAG: hypothetical protein K5853_08925, partial [Lachnospiraceae bacterium]|nr:hypothetical protein [Lachnospiraceae bacterium]